MLDQLVESRNHLGENRRRSSFLLTTFTGVFSLFTFALIYSLFSYNLAMAGENLDVSSLVAPVNVSADEPQPPKPDIQPKQQNNDKAIDKLPTRAVVMQSTDESPIKPPTEVSTEPNTNLSRPTGEFKVAPVNSEGSSISNEKVGRNTTGGGLTSGITVPTTSTKVEDDEKPPVKSPTPKVAPNPGIIRTSKILNGQAINLVKPPYPNTAKMVHASGAVNVQVTIDENGNVTAANAVSGHPLLRQVSEQAARSSKFSPTFLGTQKVKVTGVIVYNFIPQ
jgi:TonB family protein